MREDLFGGGSCVECVTLDHDAIGVDELRTGQQRARINVGCDLMDLHRGFSLLESRRKRKTSRTA